MKRKREEEVRKIIIFWFKIETQRKPFVIIVFYYSQTLWKKRKKRIRIKRRCPFVLSLSHISLHSKNISSLLLAFLSSSSIVLLRSRWSLCYLLITHYTSNIKPIHPSIPSFLFWAHPIVSLLQSYSYIYITCNLRSLVWLVCIVYNIRLG